MEASPQRLVQTPQPSAWQWTLPTIFTVSVGVIAWQLALMRCLLIARYHHFSFLVISCALLGFGAGGIVLSLARPWFERRSRLVLGWGTILFALSLPVCFRVGESLPLNVYFPPLALASSVAWWCVYWMVHSVPFLLGGLIIGVGLIAARERVNRVYACNLVGSALGGLGCIVLMEYLPANSLFMPVSISALIAGSWTLPREPAVRWKFALGSGIVGVLAVAVAAHLGPDRLFPLAVDQYKTLAFVQSLVDQGGAQRITTVHGLRGRLDLFAGPHFHTLMSLNSAVAPPPMDLLLRDGFAAGSVLSIKNLEAARFLDGTLFSLPYRLVTPRRVLILGDASGTTVWLARLSHADTIVVVQPDPHIVRILETHASGVLRDPRIRIVHSEPRAFLDRTAGSFDVVHLAGLEGFAPGSGGIGGLREDYLATVEGFRACLNVLTKHGIACVVRGIQEPERDNIKIAATWIEALEQNGTRRGGDHLLVARDELAIATLVGRSRFDEPAVERFQSAAKERSWDVEWFPRVAADDTNRVHILPGPTGTSVSWYHHALRNLLSPDRERFYRQWVAYVRPATDDRPFFYDFFRWESLSELRAAFGPLWPAKAEMGFLVLIVSLVLTALAAAILLPLPVLLLGPRRTGTSPWITVLVLIYFSALGTGFMAVEMGLIQLFTRFIGDPVAAAALVIGALLLCAGMGSMAQPSITRRLTRGLLTLGILVAGLILLMRTCLPVLFEAAGLIPGTARGVVGLVSVAPLAVLMGVPFPWGMSELQRSAPQAAPLAWAVNGFASVVSASGAVVLAMTLGFRALFLVAAAAYVLAGVCSVLLVRRSGNRVPVS